MSEGGCGFAWLQDDLGSFGFCLEVVKGVGVEELAAMLGADAGLGIVAPDVFNAAVGGAGTVPDWARLGEHGGWAYAWLGGSDGFYMRHPDHVRHLWEGRTWLSVTDTTMDPPTVDVVVDGALDWSYFDGEVHEMVRADHPLTQRMVAEIGLGTADPDPDFPDDPDEWGLHIPPIREVYRLVGEYYGVDLPRTSTAGADLVGVFTSPRVYASGERNSRYDNLRLP
ncbi:hypothetical protein ACMA1D_23370 [Streptomyces sp. 796.1]|uniref:hypothetical protein n=1 Tax=Streptomyces sp. 796.1 TaxID=3163029 RepID=UPI0039C8C95E